MSSWIFFTPGRPDKCVSNTCWKISEVALVPKCNRIYLKSPLCKMWLCNDFLRATLGGGMLAVHRVSKNKQSHSIKHQFH